MIDLILVLSDRKLAMLSVLQRNTSTSALSLRCHFVVTSLSLADVAADLSPRPHVDLRLPHWRQCYAAVKYAVWLPIQRPL
jgi:hypothetical protein